ncbi:MAG: TonB-dependent receptor [Adhaeribacter sp.]
MVSLVQVSAIGYSQKINIDKKNVTLEVVLKAIEEQSGYFFLYEASELQVAARVSIQVKNASLEEALKKTFQGQPFTYKVISRNVVITRKKEKATAPVQGTPVTVIGVVKDARNDPLPGVSVRIKDAAVGTVTDNQGRYSLEVPGPEAIMVFSFIGFDTQQKKVGTGSIINITLKESARQLDDVVVIGYGAVKKEDLTGAVSQIDMADLTKAPVSSFAEAMAGRVAGVQVSSSDGQPGVGMDIVIRGANSLTQSNAPLFVVDGFPMENFESAGLNPDDIESINILKDASATAIYGSRGANGVVVIETKKGKVGKPILTLTSSYGFQEPQKLMDLMDPYEFVKYNQELNPTQAAETYFQDDKTLESYRGAAGIDWQEHVLRRSPMQIHNVALRGGTSQTRYSLSGSVYDQEGIVLSTGYKRYQGRISLDQTISRKLKTGIIANYSKLLRSGQPVAAGGSGNFTTYLLYRTWGYRPISGNDINLLDFDDDPGNENISDVRINPITSSLNDYTRNYSNDVLTNVYLQYEIRRGLSFKTTASLNVRNSTTHRFYNSKTPQGSPLNRFSSIGIYGSVSHAENNVLSNENTLTYNKTFQGNHKLTALGGFSMQGTKMQGDGYSAMQLPNEALGIHGLDEGIPFGQTSYGSQNALVSYFGRLNYSFGSRYLFTATFRGDGSSKFAPKNRWGYFPSAAFAWNLVEEKFFKDKAYLSGSKLRASWGVTGNNRVGDFDRVPNLALPLGSAYSFNNGTPSQSIVLDELGNPDLKWESTEQIDLGYDLGLFSNRLEFTVDVYRKVTRDLLLDADLPVITGYTSARKNIGKIKNEGIELSLSTVNMRGGAFTWTSDFNISFNRNEILELTKGQQNLFRIVRVGQDNPSLYVSQVGKPAGLFYGRIFDGLYQLEDFDNPAPGVYILKSHIPSNGNLRTAIQPGHIKYKDINEDGILDDNDNTVIGRGQPIHLGGFANRFAYKGLSLNVFLQWSYGNQVYNANRMIFEGNYVGLPINQYASYIDRWSPENPSSKNYVVRGYGPAGVQSNRVLEDGSYLRLKTLSLAYAIPTRLIKKASLSRLSLTVSAQNALTFTRYSGMDPEVSVYNSVLTPGFDYSAYPIARTLNFGVNATF